MTDSSTALKFTSEEYKHDTVNHVRGEYVRCEGETVITTNAVEGYFGILKRGTDGIYHHVGKHHLHRYLSEFDFRYNAREVTDVERAKLISLWGNAKQPPTMPLRIEVKAALIFWSILLIPWLPIMLLSGLAFDAGEKWFAYVFVWSMWTYPIILAIAFIFRRSKIAFFLVLLPVLNVVGCTVSGSYPKH